MLGRDARPVAIGVPIGDPNGIGPEVAVRAVLALKNRDYGVFLVGDSWVVRRAVSLVAEAGNVQVRVLAGPEDIPGDMVTARGGVDVLDVVALEVEELSPGTVSAKAGKASLDYLNKALELAMSGRIDGIACAPANKEAMKLAGSPFNGQTELVASAVGAREAGTALVSGKFRVFQVTGHVSLRKACDMITEERVLSNIRMARKVLSEDFGIDDPLVAVCGLNPHSGDGGLLGNEEQDHIIPAINKARAEGIRVDGPLPGDTAFLKVKREGHDGIVAMYHDQANAVLKFISSEAVTVTTGLPIVRTTVGHGTAFDIAWKGVADPGCMIGAIEVAAQLARVRKERGLRAVGR
ncbi:MAG TPA: 4-hydroxythreonine-4-phosphate dehydrogenase PdxA [Firmicutes bacterium]|nr:4-hydroxythreonine-4-phosphate dehydrogenase PdxA [Bacillota bacterium]